MNSLRPVASRSPVLPMGSAPPPPPSAPPPPSTAPVRTTLSPHLAGYLRNTTPVVATAKAPGGGALQDKVDAYLTSARHKYLVDGRTVEAAPQFRMVGGHNQQNTAKGLAALAGKMGNKPDQIPLPVVGRVLAGRGSPQEVGRVTQALIDLGKLPPSAPGKSDAARIQEMMWEHGVGIDCAGYVQQALAAVHGKSKQQMGLRDSIQEDLGMLDKNPAFKKVNIFDARPGDVITLRDNNPKQPGHTVLVARHDKATGAEMAWRFDLKRPDSAEFLRSKSLDVFEVDSSWGAGRDGTEGGLKRVLWVHNRETGNWASFDNRGLDMILDTTPYIGHTLVGAYRPQ